MLLNTRDLNVHIAGLHILRDINIGVEEGELIVILGANGAGKSTLMRTIAGLQKPSSGGIEFQGAPLEKLSANAVAARRIALVPEGRCLFADMTVLENLEMGAYLHRRDKAFIEKKLAEVYALFPALKKYENKPAGALSGGEQQMVSIGRGLMLDPKLLLLDELSLGLAPMVVDMLLRIVRQLIGQGISVLMVEQNVRQALKYSDRGYVVDNGSILMEGSRDELMNSEKVQSAYMGV